MTTDKYEHFYPLTHNEDGSFTEGYWHWFTRGSSRKDFPKLPFPKATDIPVDPKFLEKLQQVMPFCNFVSFLGCSPCRLCDKWDNGSSEYDLSYNDQHFRFPDGIIHYYTIHNVHPSTEFVKFIMDVDIDKIKFDRRKQIEDDEADSREQVYSHEQTEIFARNRTILRMQTGLGSLQYF